MLRRAVKPQVQGERRRRAQMNGEAISGDHEGKSGSRISTAEERIRDATGARFAVALARISAVRGQCGTQGTSRNVRASGTSDSVSDLCRMAAADAAHIRVFVAFRFQTFFFCCLASCYPAPQVHVCMCVCMYACVCVRGVSCENLSAIRTATTGQPTVRRRGQQRKRDKEGEHTGREGLL